MSVDKKLEESGEKLADSAKEIEHSTLRVGASADRRTVLAGDRPCLQPSEPMPHGCALDCSPWPAKSEPANSSPAYCELDEFGDRYRSDDVQRLLFWGRRLTTLIPVRGHPFPMYSSYRPTFLSRSTDSWHWLLWQQWLEFGSAKQPDLRCSPTGAVIINDQAMG